MLTQEASPQSSNKLLCVSCPEIGLHKSVKIWKDIQKNIHQNGNLDIRTSFFENFCQRSAATRGLGLVKPKLSI
jgi:hypothetical protein